MRSRRVFALGAFIGVAGWAACSQYGETDLIPPVSDAGNDTTSSGNDASSLDGDRDVLVVDDAGIKIDAAGCDASAVCDCDKDGYQHAGTLLDGAVCDASVAQKNIDCDDYDPRARPGQNYLDIPGEPPLNGDWDCSGIVERLHPTGVNCGTTNNGACASTHGFRDAPDCGASSIYVTCKVVTVITCVEDTTQVKTQACK